MLALFQEGIPDLFFPQLLRRGIRPERFPTDRSAALQYFEKHHAAELLFFRANFILDERALDRLPCLTLAVLVSTGTDSVDCTALEKRGIRLITGEGANAQAVCDYVLQALCFGGFNFNRDALGVVGKGRIGSLVMEHLTRADVRVAYYDPLLPEPGSLETVLDCDVVTFHTPLTRHGEHATEKMLGARYFTPVKKKLRLIQACRGGIWDTEFYRSLSSHPYLEILAQDVYPEEPPPPEYLQHAMFSTPHIAGYSTRGRLGGVLNGLRVLLPDLVFEEFFPKSRAWFLDEESAQFSRAVHAFNALRDQYYWRKEFHEYDATERRAWLKRFPDAPPEIFFLPK